MASKARRVKDVVKTVVDRLLPEGVELNCFGPEDVLFNTPYRRATPMLELSDGYRSMLALAADLLRRLDEAHERVDDWIDPDGRVIAEGVVLIDELDAHLHPIWQRQIGFWLPEQFPNLQFIVATHSPFVPQAADRNAVWVLRADSMVADTVRASQDQPSVKGWRVDQILNVLFNLSDLRDPETEEKMRRHAELQARQTAGMLDLKEGLELADLAKWLDTYLSPPGDSAQEMEKYAAIKDQVDAFLRKQRGSEPNATS